MEESEKRGRKTVHRMFVPPKGVVRGLFHEYVLKRIADKPVHGYELLRGIEKSTKGAWRPSAGSIYPVLRQLLAEGYVRTIARRKAGRRQRVYQITRSGVKHLQQQGDMILKAGKNYGAMRPVIIELISPQHVPALFTRLVTGQFELIQGIVESKTDKISPKEVKMMLEKYLLDLEKQSEWARKMLKRGRLASG